MGNKMFDHWIYIPMYPDNYKTCLMDADCYPAHDDYPEATDPQTQGSRCCMYNALRKKGPSYTAEVNRHNMGVIFGWPDEFYQYVKTCNYDYPKYFLDWENAGAQF